MSRPLPRSGRHLRFALRKGAQDPAVPCLASAPVSLPRGARGGSRASSLLLPNLSRRPLFHPKHQRTKGAIAAKPPQLSSPAEFERRCAPGRSGVFGPLVLWVKPSSSFPPVLFHPGLAGAFRQVPDPADIGLALGDRDDSPRLEDVEDVAGLD